MGDMSQIEPNRIEFKESTRKEWWIGWRSEVYRAIVTDCWLESTIFCFLSSRVWLSFSISDSVGVCHSGCHSVRRSYECLSTDSSSHPTQYLTANRIAKCDKSRAHERTAHNNTHNNTITTIINLILNSVGMILSLSVGSLSVDWSVVSKSQI